MGDSGSSDSWKKLVIAKANDQWISMSNIKQEQSDEVGSEFSTENFSLDYEQSPYDAARSESFAESDNRIWQVGDPLASPESDHGILISRREKSESAEERASRLAKMSAYAAQRLANETPEQRATRLKRMSEYAAKRLASETSEQRAKRLARMSAYAAKRLAQETPEQRQARLTRMSAYAAKRHAMKKMNEAPPTRNIQTKKHANVNYNLASTLQKPNQS